MEMKKNIGFVNLDSSTAQWLQKHLPSGELKDSVQALINGDCSTLMLEMEGDMPAFHAHVLQCGELVIDEKRRRVERSGEEVFLTPKEFDILLFLARNKGEVLTKEQIYQAVWANDYLMDDSNVMAFIRKLRKKIETNPDAPEYILTVWGVGYKFRDTW